MEYLLMLTSIVFSVVSSGFLKDFGIKEKNKDMGDMLLFNAFISTVWIVILAIWLFASGDTTISRETYFFGAAYGTALAAFLVTKSLALSEGPVSLTTLIGSCAFIQAVVFGVFYNDEVVNVLQISGVLLMTFSLLLCVNPKKAANW